ncbi:TUBA3, partial [Symbiodinium necroappetens]
MASASQLPACLSKLPSPQLEAVHEALLELLGYGLSEVTDVDELAKRVKAKLHAADSRRAVSEEHPSEYASMCRWAWTPKRWHESRAATGAPAGAPSAEL